VESFFHGQKRYDKDSFVDKTIFLSVGKKITVKIISATQNQSGMF